MPIDIDPEPLRYRRTKIVATVGPSSRTPELLAKLVDAGVDVFRLNFSHGTADEHREVYERIRAVTAERAPATAVLGDLGGPKIRVGLLAGGSITLAADERVTVTTRDVEGEPGLIPTQYTELADDVRPGDRILLDDGNLELAVDGVEGTEIACRVVTGGVLKSRKGMNLPGVSVSAPALTDKDRRDAELALELGVDFLALSFVRRGADVVELREIVERSGRKTAIIAKIEKPEALADIDSIVDAADGLMIARGDLGVELEPQAVPLAQDQLIDLARRRAKPVIVATQMLESMIENPRPTRAEVSDVANAVRSGTDAVMLSGETAAGAYPLEAVSMMDDVVRRTERYLWSRGSFATPRRQELATEAIPIEDALAASLAQLSGDLRARAIVVLSASGRSVRVAASSRPQAPTVAVLADIDAARRTNLVWGSLPRVVKGSESLDSRELAGRLLEELGLADAGNAFLVVRGFRSDPRLSFPTISIGRVQGPGD